jgi:hypothetical protein
MYLIPIYRFTTRLVQEKSKDHGRIKDLAVSMGASTVSYWMSWFITFMINVTLIALISALVLKYGLVMPSSALGPIFILLWLYGLAMFGYTVLISSFFNSPGMASMTATLVFFVSSFVDQLVSFKHTSTTSKLLGSLLPSVAI